MMMMMMMIMMGVMSRPAGGSPDTLNIDTPKIWKNIEKINES